MTWRALPTVLPELAMVGGVVADATHVVQRPGPGHVEAHLVGPGGDGREVAVCIRGENAAELFNDGGVQVDLGDGGDNFVSYEGVSNETK